MNGNLTCSSSRHFDRTSGLSFHLPQGVMGARLFQLDATIAQRFAKRLLRLIKEKSLAFLTKYELHRLGVTFFIVIEKIQSRIRLQQSAQREQVHAGFSQDKR